MKRKGFIIRPFDREYDRFSQLIMERSLTEAGYEPVLLKDHPENGHILSNIIRNICESHLCLALLTGLNWNVAYELGIRHARCPRGTIMLCDEAEKGKIEKCAFDIRDWNLIYYPHDWFRETAADAVIISEIIHLIEQGSHVPSDSPVFSVYPSDGDTEDATVQYCMGLCYADGHGVEKNEEKAVAWYRKAAAQDHADAQYCLGICYANGQGVEKNEEEAVAWYRRAAAQDHADAQYCLGICYENGLGVGKDDAQAMKWYGRAAENGCIAAEKRLSYLRAKGEL